MTRVTKLGDVGVTASHPSCAGARKRDRVPVRSPLELQKPGVTVLAKRFTLLLHVKLEDKEVS